MYSSCILFIYSLQLILSSDQHQIPPCDIYAQLSAQVLRIKEMLIRDELF